MIGVLVRNLSLKELKELITPAVYETLKESLGLKTKLVVQNINGLVMVVSYLI